MKIESENSVRRPSFFVPSTGHQNYSDKSLKGIKKCYDDLKILSSHFFIQSINVKKFGLKFFTVKNLVRNM